MDLTSRLRGRALARPTVLLVDAPGSRALRWEAEAELDRRGWPHALSPADADLLLVLGAARTELAEAADALWAQIPRPRHRVAVVPGAPVGPLLDAVHRCLGCGRIAEPAPCAISTSSTGSGRGRSLTA